MKAQIAREFRSKYPDKPSHALARLMYKKHPEAFKDVENARYALRYIEGKVGAKDRKCVKDTEFFKAEDRPKNPYKLPPSEEKDFAPYFITGHKKVAVFADIHAPYHSIEALTVAIDFCKKQKVDALLLLGDFIDFYQLSRFEKDPRKRKVADELKAAKELLAIFQKELKCKIYYKLGNHCERFEKYMVQKAPELLDIDDFKLENVLRLKDYNCEMITDKRIIKINKLNAIHGHEFATSVFSPVNVARGLFLRGKVSAMQGHNHSTSEHTEPNMDGDITTTWSLGCLCELNPGYMPINKWNHGFAIVEPDENGKDYRVINKRIYKGQVL